MFQDRYKSAYGKISPGRDLEFTEAEIEMYMNAENSVEDGTKLVQKGGGQEKSASKTNDKQKKTGWKILRPVAVASLAACLVLVFGLPVAARNIPEFYDVLNRHAPGLVDYMIPVQKSDSSSGIILQVEAAQIKGNTAEILVSFSDDGSGDFIHGMVDLYDSYNLYSYSGESNVGGCFFMEYNEEQDKAYFQIDLKSTDGTFDASKLEFSVIQLLTDCESYTTQIPLDNILQDFSLKPVTLNGGGGMDAENEALDRLTIPGNELDPRPGNLVLDIPLDDLSPESMQITAVAYMDGILRVQLYRGNFKAADRHMWIYMLDEVGNEVYPDMSVMWHDTVAGEEVLVDEYYFVITEEQLQVYTLWGEGEVRAGSVKGNWSITFDVE